jgi:hypothetical protein
MPADRLDEKALSDEQIETWRSEAMHGQKVRAEADAVSRAIRCGRVPPSKTNDRIIALCDALRASRASTRTDPGRDGERQRGRADGLDEAAAILVGCWDEGDQGTTAAEAEESAEVQLLRLRATEVRRSLPASQARAESDPGATDERKAGIELAALILEAAPEPWGMTAATRVRSLLFVAPGPDPRESEPEAPREVYFARWLASRPCECKPGQPPCFPCGARALSSQGAGSTPSSAPAGDGKDGGR